MAKKVRTDKKQGGLSEIKLDGESDGEVPVYETCDAVRKKIKNYLKASNITRAEFLRAIGATHPKKKKFQSKSLNDFLSKRGANAGNTSGIFYAAYIFFEKMRIYDGQPKSDFRLTMEDIYDGFDRWGNNGKSGVSLTERNTKYICGPGQQPYVDLYGCVRVQ